MQAGTRLVVNKQVFLDNLSLCMQKMTVIGPQKLRGGEVTFGPLRSLRGLTLDYVNDLDPLKRFFLPQREVLFAYDLSGKKPRLLQPEQERPRLLFGIRSCDVQGLAHMDGFFQGACYDELYWARRRNTLIISMACNRPNESCFCICCNGGPWLESGFDLQLTDLGEEFLIDIGSRAGRVFLEERPMPAVTASRRHETRRRELMEACDAQMVPTAYLAKACIQITNNRVREELWEEMGSECFSCGGCTHVCPCCTCFDVVDCPEGAKSGTRVRCWDSCQYSGFTREASGHNPRARAKERVKRRFYHKLSYAYIQQDGHPGCVGCGRCITVCEAFGLLDISAVVKRLRRDGQ
ncbi:MAG TPA: 4Fe-4S dicluster domain-containing protein [bacterium]|nr:4Fe-4S dicluster domain-containing protein [bacterium]HPG83959.1 4Fe-4S dicluster domain-containing protein [bacterium]HPM60202.1 4Fe-4S dicluster domain-containing protein [bacterium]